MANRGRSSAGPYPGGQHQGGQYPGDQHPGDQYPPDQYPQDQYPPDQEGRQRERQLPPPEWADPAMGRRWTNSWRANPTGAQPSLPTPPPGRGPTGALPRTPTGPMPRRPTGSWPASAPAQSAPWETQTTANPVLAPTRTTYGNQALAPTRTTGPVAAAGPGRTTGPVRTSGALRTAKPITPGTGRERVILPIVVLFVIALGLAGVGYLWWRNTLFLHTPGALLTDVGEVLGLISGYGVVVLVALMSRLPPLERGIGTDRLARWHTIGGRIVISAVSGHVVFTIWGFAVTAHESVTRETITLETTFPDILMATVAWGLLLMVAAISIRAARRRVAYETWYYAHLYTYLAIALAFSHQFANGGAFAESFQSRVAWSAMYAVVGALLLWWRVITPLRRSARHQFTVQAVRPEAPGIVSVLISGREFDHLRAEPGQFFRWRFLTRELWWQSHPYSLSAMPQPDLMRITVKARGDHSGSLANLRPGTRIVAEGPYGAFTPSLTGRRVLFIAGGVGITPIRAMFAALPKRMSGGITLLYRASHPRDVVFSRELNAIATDRQAALHYLIGSREELGYDPLDAIHLERTVPGLHRYEAYVCGPTGMTQAAVNALVAAGVPRRRIHHESFDL